MGTGISTRKPGRPPGAKNKQTLLAIAISEGLESLAVEEMPKVVRAAINLAKGGSVPAMALLMKYFMRTANESQQSDQLGKVLESGDVGFSLTINVVNKPTEPEGVLIEGDPVVDVLPEGGATATRHASPVDAHYLTPSVGA